MYIYIYIFHEHNGIVMNHESYILALQKLFLHLITWHCSRFCSDIGHTNGHDHLWFHISISCCLCFVLRPQIHENVGHLDQKKAPFDLVNVDALSLDGAGSSADTLLLTLTDGHVVRHFPGHGRLTYIQFCSLDDILHKELTRPCDLSRHFNVNLLLPSIIWRHVSW